MTEQEINEKILSEEEKLRYEYNALLSRARRLSNAAAVNMREMNSEHEAQLRFKRIRNTLLPLLISVAGFVIIISEGMWFLSILMIIGGIVLAFCLNQIAGKELHDAVAQHQSAEKNIDDQVKNLRSIISGCERQF